MNPETIGNPKELVYKDVDAIFIKLLLMMMMM